MTSTNKVAVSPSFVVLAARQAIGGMTYDQVDFCVELIELWPLLAQPEREQIHRWISWWIRDRGHAALEIDAMDVWCRVKDLPIS